MIYMTFSDILRLIYNLLRMRQVSLTALKVPLNLWSNFPYDFVYMKKEPWKSRNLRIMPVDNYIVLYIADDNKHTVTIVRIMYGGRNVDSQLKK